MLELVEIYFFEVSKLTIREDSMYVYVSNTNINLCFKIVKIMSSRVKVSPFTYQVRILCVGALAFLKFQESYFAII